MFVVDPSSRNSFEEHVKSSIYTFWCRVGWKWLDYILSVATCRHYVLF